MEISKRTAVFCDAWARDCQKQIDFFSACAIRGAAKDFFVSIEAMSETLKEVEDNLNEYRDIIATGQNPKFYKFKDSLTLEYVFLTMALRYFPLLGVNSEGDISLFSASAAFRGAESQSTEKRKAAIEALTGNKLGLGFEGNEVLALRLDAEEGASGYSFVATVPRSRIKLGSACEYTFVPLSVVLKASEILHNLNTISALGLRYISHDGSEKELKVAKLDYEGKFAPDIESTLGHYSPVTMSMPLIDLEASLSSLGLLYFDILRITGVRALSEAEMTSDYQQMDTKVMRQVALTKIRQVNKGGIESLPFVRTPEDNTLAILRSLAMTWVNKQTDKQLYLLMQQFPAVFGDNIGDEVATRTKRLGTELKSLTPVKPFDSLKVYRDFLNKGIVKVTAKAKTGRFYSITGTNNPDLLMKYLGSTYSLTLGLGEYDRVQNAVGILKKYAKEETTEKALKALNALGIPTIAGFEPNVGDSHTELVNYLETVRQTLMDTFGDKEQVNISIRSIYATNERDFFFSVKPESVAGLSVALKD